MSAEATNATTTQLSAVRSPGTIPSSIAIFASSGGASDADGREDERDEHQDQPRAVGAQQHEQAAQLAAAAGGLAQAPEEVVAARAQKPATSRSGETRLRKTWSGSPFSTISR